MSLNKHCIDERFLLTAAITNDFHKLLEALDMEVYQETDPIKVDSRLRIVRYTLANMSLSELKELKLKIL